MAGRAAEHLANRVVVRGQAVADHEPGLRAGEHLLSARPHRLERLERLLLLDRRHDRRRVPEGERLAAVLKDLDLAGTQKVPVQGAVELEQRDLALELECRRPRGTRKVWAAD